MYRKVLSEAETYNRVAEAAMANDDYEIAQQFLEQALFSASFAAMVYETVLTPSSRRVS
jgi:hypothetical protein